MKKSFLLLLMLISGFQLRAQETAKTFTVYFNHDSYALTETAKATLDSIAPYTKQFNGTSISSIGYTDDSGTFDYNKILAANRANAAKEYLEAKGLEVLETGGNLSLADKPKTPEKQRRAVITVKGIKTAPAPDCVVNVSGGFEQQEFKGPEGTIVIANVPAGSSGAITVNEFFTPRSMINGGMYCMDTDDDILQTAGMIEICRNTIEADPSGEFYIVKMPAGNRLRINTFMTVWLSVRNSSGELRWQNTTIEITSDPENKYYIFKVPVGTEGCIKINLDMPCARRNGCRVVYVATHKPYYFKDVSVGSKEGGTLSFSAKVNDTLWAFTGDRRAKVRDMDFKGYYEQNGEEKVLEVRMKDMKYSAKVGKRSNIYYIYQDKIRQRGFWAWVRRQFKGE